MHRPVSSEDLTLGEGQIFFNKYLQPIPASYKTQRAIQENKSKKQCDFWNECSYRMYEKLKKKLYSDYCQ